VDIFSEGARRRVGHKPKINKYFLTGAAVIEFALRKSMSKTVKNEKLSEPQASFFRLGF